MERQKNRLVESIFDRPKPKEGESRKIPSLFHPPPPPAPAPEKEAKRVSAGRPIRRFPLGLDVGVASLKWAQLGLVEDRIQVVALGSQGFPSPAALPEVLKKHGLTGPAVLSLPLEEVTLRLLRMPALPESEMGQAVRWQIEQSLPSGVSLSEFTFDYLVLEEVAGQGKSQVLVTTASRQRVMAMVEQAKIAGLKTVAVEIDPFALAAGLAWIYPAFPRQTSLVLHLGDVSASLSVVVKGQLAFSRSLLTSDRSLTQVVSDHLRIPVEKADRLKRMQGLLATVEGAEEAAAVSKALASSLENLVVDVLHAFTSFSHQVVQSKTGRFEQVYLSGEVAQLPGIVPWLADRLQAPVERVNPFRAFPPGDSVRPVTAWESRASEFAVAVGLALHGVPENYRP